jgi:hypothetical protein
MLDIEEALLISELQIRCAVPIKIIHYPSYFRDRGHAEYGLSQSKSLYEMDKNLKRSKMARESLSTGEKPKKH